MLAKAFSPLSNPYEAFSISEMTSDSAIVHGTERTSGYVRFGSCPYTGLQLFGHDPETLANAATTALRDNPNIDFFDVNMSCPVEKVIRSGSGSALMSDPRRCGDIVRAVRSAVDVPVTVKIRLGTTMEALNFRDVIEETVTAGADAVSLHTRTAKERYAGSPHHMMAEGLQEEMSVPLVISYLRTGERLPDPTVSQQIDWCLELMDMVFREKGDEVGLRKMRCFAPRFIVGCRGCREYRRRLAAEPRSREEMTALLEEIRQRKGDEVIRANGAWRNDDRDDFCCQ